VYANQHSVTRLRQQFTLEELTREFNLDEDDQAVNGGAEQPGALTASGHSST